MSSPSTAIKYRLSFTTGGLFWSESINLIETYPEVARKLMEYAEAAREDIGYRSRRWALRSFDPCVMTSKTQKLYEKLLPQGKCK